jgi:hypothetical protein
MRVLQHKDITVRAEGRDELTDTMSKWPYANQAGWSHLGHKFYWQSSQETLTLI